MREIDYIGVMGQRGLILDTHKKCMNVRELEGYKRVIENKGVKRNE